MSLMKDRYEMTAESQRDITPEQASKRLRECVIWNCIETVQFPRADQQYRVSFGTVIKRPHHSFVQKPPTQTAQSLASRMALQTRISSILPHSPYPLHALYSTECRRQRKRSLKDHGVHGQAERQIRHTMIRRKHNPPMTIILLPKILPIRTPMERFIQTRPRAIRPLRP
jgi:hypothetical protein